MYQSYQAFASQPLGPALPIAQQTLPPTWTATPASPSLGKVTLVPTISFPTNTPAAIVRRTQHDEHSRDRRRTRAQIVINTDLGDVIRLVRVDFVTPKVTVLEFPRDLWVEIPNIADNLNGQDHEKLNQAYLYGQPGTALHIGTTQAQGPGLLSLTLDSKFRRTWQIIMCLSTCAPLKKWSMQLTELTINVPDLETAYNTGLPIGNHHLNGAEALKVARNRQEGMFERANNQNLVLCAMRKKVTQSNQWSHKYQS